MNEPQLIGTCILVLNSDKTKVLLGKRKNSYKADWFGLPGGRVEVGENVNLSANRELTEETSLKAKKIKYLGAIKEFQGKKDFVHFAFVCEEYKGEPTCTEPDKCEGWEFYSLEGLPQHILPGHLGAIEMFLKNDKERLISI